MITWDEPTWRDRIDEHAHRVQPWIAPRLDRRSRGESHPVDDFLFDYYSFRPAQLARWHPGAGVALTGDVSQWSDVTGYVTASGTAHVDESAVDSRMVHGFLEIMRRTAERPAGHGCFGRHEWAMVYGLQHGDVRHASWPLRLTPAEIDDVVESSPLRCTHFDAFRFYTSRARPLNIVQPTRLSQADHEQPGCLHATMDLYKWAFRSYPLVGADLTADCFDLAREVRAVDMRAAPYDLTALGYDPIRIETAEGRAEFVAYQRDFAVRGGVLRARLIEVLDVALSATVSQ